jgi:hypothetical protein
MQHRRMTARGYCFKLMKLADRTCAQGICGSIRDPGSHFDREWIPRKKLKHLSANLDHAALGETQRAPVSIRHDAKPEESENHHGPNGGFRDGCNVYKRSGERC